MRQHPSKIKKKLCEKSLSLLERKYLKGVRLITTLVEFLYENEKILPK